MLLINKPKVFFEKIKKRFACFNISMFINKRFFVKYKIWLLLVLMHGHVLLISNMLNNLELYNVEKKICSDILNSFICNKTIDREIAHEEETEFEREIIQLIADSYRVTEDLNVTSCYHDKVVVKKWLQRIDMFLKKNPKLTNLFKNIGATFCKNMLKQVDSINTLFFNDAKMHDGCENDISQEEALLFDEFARKHFNLAQPFLEGVILFYEKLKKELFFHKSLIPIAAFRNLNIVQCYRFNIFCSHLLNKCNALTFSKKLKKICKDLIIGFQQSFEDLPYEVRYYLIAKIETFVDDPEIELIINSLRMFVQHRKDILSQLQADKEDLDFYEKSLELCVVKIKKTMITKKQDQNVSSKNLKSDPNLIPGIVALERLIFKK